MVRRDKLKGLPRAGLVIGSILTDTANYYGYYKWAYTHSSLFVGIDAQNFKYICLLVIDLEWWRRPFRHSIPYDWFFMPKRSEYNWKKKLEY